MPSLVQNPTRILFFTGKGGVGKTSSACATAIALADAGKRVLLVSTDPASNLDEVLGVKLHLMPTPVPNVSGLSSRPLLPHGSRAHPRRARAAWCGQRSAHRLIVNGVFRARDASDAIAVAMEARMRASLEHLPLGLRSLPRTEVPLLPFGLVGIDALRQMGASQDTLRAAPATVRADRLDALVDRLAKHGRGVIMTMGKGGVGKTTIAARIATALAQRGFSVTLTTTDPAAHVDRVARELSGSMPSGLRVTRSDPALETRRYTEQVLATAGNGLDAQGKALLEEDLRSPCTEEIAVFRAFAKTVAQGADGFVVIDTAPTGHTLLLLDATETYHREVLKKPSGSPEAVQRLLPRLRDREFTQVLLVTLPEATPMHEAMQLERDLARADIRPFAWVVNQSLTPLEVTDPVLRSRQNHEATHLRERVEHTEHIVLEPWSASFVSGQAQMTQRVEAST